MAEPFRFPASRRAFFAAAAIGGLGLAGCGRADDGAASDGLAPGRRPQDYPVRRFS